MKLMEGKKGVIFGVSNTHGIAYAIAKQLYEAGADIAFTYAGEAMEKRVRPLAEEMGAKIIMNCDVTKEDEVAAVFKYAFHRVLYVLIHSRIDGQSAARHERPRIGLGVAELALQIVNNVRDDHVGKVRVRLFLLLSRRIFVILQLLVNRLIVFALGNIALLVHLIQHGLLPLLGGVRILKRIVCRRILRQARNQGTLREI